MKDFTKRWKDKTECSEGYKTTDCKNGPKATPTPTARRRPEGAPPPRGAPADAPHPPTLELSSRLRRSAAPGRRFAFK